MQCASPHAAWLDALRLLHDADEPVEGSFRHLALEATGQLNLLVGQRDDAARGPLLVLEGRKPPAPVASDPDAQRLGLHVQGLAVGILPDLGGELLEHRSALSSWGRQGEVGADDHVARERLGSASIVVALGHDGSPG